MIEITDKGAEKVREFLASQPADVPSAGPARRRARRRLLRASSTSWPSTSSATSDAVFESHGLKLLVDRREPAVRARLDDRLRGKPAGRGLQGQQPNVVAACGCGSSFRVAEEEQVSAV